jgi:chromosome segregation ATPase
VSYATLLERSGALNADVTRIEDANSELESRVRASQAAAADIETKSESLRKLVEETVQMLDREAERLETLRGDVRAAEDTVTDLRQQADRIETATRAARRSLEAIHAELSELEVSRATEESGLAHLAHSCVDTLQQTLDGSSPKCKPLPRRAESGGIDGSVGFSRTVMAKRIRKTPRKRPTRRPSLPSPSQPRPRSTSRDCATRSNALAR